MLVEHATLKSCVCWFYLAGSQHDQIPSKHLTRIGDFTQILSHIRLLAKIQKFELQLDLFRMLDIIDIITGYEL